MEDFREWSRNAEKEPLTSTEVARENLWKEVILRCILKDELELSDTKQKRILSQYF